VSGEREGMMRWFWHRYTGYELMGEFLKLSKRPDNQKTTRFVVKYYKRFPMDQRGLVVSTIIRHVIDKAGWDEGRKYWRKQFDNLKGFEMKEDDDFHRMWQKPAKGTMYDMYQEALEEKKKAEGSNYGSRVGPRKARV
jgi:hypothetical protein